VAELHAYEVDVARLISGSYEEVVMEDGYRDAQLRQTASVVAHSARRGLRWWMPRVAAAAAVVGLTLGAWHLVGKRRARVGEVAPPPFSSPDVLAALPSAAVTPEEGGPLVAVIAASGSVEDGNGDPVAVGDKLPIGATVRTGLEARVTLITRRGTEFTLAGESTLALEGAHVAALTAGRLYCRSRGGEVSRIDTAAGRIHLLGTTLDAHVQNESTVAVTVLDGKVRLANGHGEAEVTSGRRSVLVAALPPGEGVVIDRASAAEWYYGRTDIESDFGDIAYVVSREDAQGLATEVWAMDRDGGSKRRLKTYLGWGRAPGPWLPGQRWLVYNANSILWTHPDFDSRRAHTGAGHPIVDDQAWLLNAVTDQDVVFDLPPGTDPLYTDLSPDGTRLVFNGRYQSDPDDRETREGGLWLFDMTTGEMTKLLDGWMKTPMSWAPDGRRIVADTGEGYGVHHPLVVVDADTGQVRELGVNGAGATFSPDGAKVAYCGEFQGGGSWFRGVPTTGRILVHDLRTDESVPISPSGEGALEPRWSPDGRHVTYRVNRQHSASICIAAADGSGSAAVFQTEAKVRSFAWMPSGDALYLATEQGIQIIAADGSGLLADLGGSVDDSLLASDQAEQTAGALDAIQEAIYQYALGNMRRFEGKPTDARAAFRAAADIFGGLAWEYPLADVSLGQLLRYADKCAELAAASSEQLLAKSCQERMNYLGYRLVAYVADTGEFPSSLSAVVKHSLKSDWGMDWFSNRDREWVKMLFRCPVSGLFTYHQPTDDAEFGDVLVTCRAHPDHKLVWTMGRAEQVSWYLGRGEAQKEADLLEKARATRDAIGYGQGTWRDAEKAYLAVLEELPNSQMAKEYLGRIYARQGRFEEALAVLPPYRGGWSALHRAFCYDALGQRERAVAIYQALLDRFGPADHIGEWAARGIQEPTWMHDIEIAAEPGEARLKPDRSWHASASVSWEYSDSERSSPALAIDGNRVTYWFTGNGQEPGQWFKLEFDAPMLVTRFVLDHHGEQSIYPTDWPRGVKAFITEDGKIWTEVAATRAGIMKPVSVDFGSPRRIKGVRFECTASHQPESWGIFEVFVFAPES